MQKTYFKKLLFPTITIIIIIFIILIRFAGDNSKKQALIDNSSTKIMSWGSNKEGQMGINPLEGVVNVPGTVTEVAAGKYHSLALLSNGTILSWGKNDEGQLGRSTENVVDPSPTVVTGISDVVAIAAQNEYSLALKKDGTVWSWGDNFTGALGTGDNENKSLPTQILGLPEISSIAAGHKFAMAIDTKGNVWAWGASCSPEGAEEAVKLLNQKASSDTSGTKGEYYTTESVGEGTYDHGEDCLNEDVVGIKSKTPKKLDSSLKGAISLSLGYGHALILKQNGDVWSFGCNLYGQLGRDTFDNIVEHATPQKVASLSDVISISAGFRHSMALTKNGEVYVWGINAKNEQKQGGSTFNQGTPLLFPFSKKINKIINGHDYSLVQDETGALLGWGTDTANFFSIGAPRFQNIPHVLGTPLVSPKKTIAAGKSHIISIQEVYE